MINGGTFALTCGGGSTKASDRPPGGGWGPRWGNTERAVRMDSIVARRNSKLPARNRHISVAV